MNESELWIVFPLFIGMNDIYFLKNQFNLLFFFSLLGSFHSIMQNVFKHGLNEHVIASILKSILQALLYIHNQG